VCGPKFKHQYHQKTPNLSIIIAWFFSTDGGDFFSPGDTWSQLETVVKTGDANGFQRAEQSRGAAKLLTMHKTAPQQRLIWLRKMVVLRLCIAGLNRFKQCPGSSLRYNSFLYTVPWNRAEPHRTQKYASSHCNLTQSLNTNKCNNSTGLPSLHRAVLRALCGLDHLVLSIALWNTPVIVLIFSEAAIKAQSG
jgi:hypothetical protein